MNGAGFFLGEGLLIRGPNQRPFVFHQLDFLFAAGNDLARLVVGGINGDAGLDPGRQPLLLVLLLPAQQGNVQHADIVDVVGLACGYDLLQLPVKLLVQAVGKEGPHHAEILGRPGVLHPYIQVGDLLAQGCLVEVGIRVQQILHRAQVLGLLAGAPFFLPFAQVDPYGDHNDSASRNDGHPAV